VLVAGEALRLPLTSSPSVLLSDAMIVVSYRAGFNAAGVD